MPVDTQARLFVDPLYCSFGFLLTACLGCAEEMEKEGTCIGRGQPVEVGVAAAAANFHLLEDSELFLASAAMVLEAEMTQEGAAGL